MANHSWWDNAGLVGLARNLEGIMAKGNNARKKETKKPKKDAAAKAAPPAGKKK